MIDFRYHLISLIAVILALALGILAGSGFLGGPILNQLKRDVSTIRERARSLQEIIDLQDGTIRQAESFTEAAEPLLIHGELAGEELVVFQFEGTEGRVADGVRSGLTEAGAQIVSGFTFTSKFSLSSAPATDELALITGSLTGETDQILEQVAAMIGERAGAAAADDPRSDGPTAAMQRFDALIDQLESSGFVEADGATDARAIPPGAGFVIIGGSTGRAPFDVGPFGAALGDSLSQSGSPTMLVESSTSTWALVRSIRRDVAARAGVATVDNAETTVGRIAVVMGLDQAEQGVVGHYGVQAGRTAIIPAPDPTG